VQRTTLAVYLISFFLLGPAFGQSWPTRPLRIIVAGAAGSSLDIPVRVVGEKLKDRLGQPIVVENRVAAGGTLATDAAAKSAPDGYTFVMSFNGPLAYGPFLYSKLPYDPQTDLAPVIQMGGQPFVLGVPASLGISSLQELVEMARASPGRLNYSSLGNGSGTHITMELLKSQAKIFMLHIPYTGGVAASTAVASADVQAHFAPIPTVMPHVRAGRVKLIAMSSEKRFALMPEIATVAERGFPGFDSYGWNGILAPAGTPREIIVRLNREINEVFQLQDIRTLLANQQIEIAGGTPEAFAELIRRETERWGPVIRAIGARLD
jgi:tripartite-type tricarboxylate transporter receptor subunit TctC